MTRVLLTGAAGFIGSHLAEALLARGDQVTGVDNFDPFYPRAVKERNLAAARERAGLETELLVYPEAGHDISGDGWAPTIVGIERGGGSAEANARAQADAWPKILGFLERTLRPDKTDD